MSEPVPDKVLVACSELLKEGKNVSAIRLLQAETGYGLKAAKQVIEGLAESLFNG